MDESIAPTPTSRVSYIYITTKLNRGTSEQEFAIRNLGFCTRICHSRQLLYALFENTTRR